MGCWEREERWGKCEGVLIVVAFNRNRKPIQALKWPLRVVETRFANFSLKYSFFFIFFSHVQRHNCFPNTARHILSAKKILLLSQKSSFGGPEKSERVHCYISNLSLKCTKIFIGQIWKNSLKSVQYSRTWNCEFELFRIKIHLEIVVYFLGLNESQFFALDIKWVIISPAL